jgi:hypothetical protein
LLSSISDRHRYLLRVNRALTVLAVVAPTLATTLLPVPAQAATAAVDAPTLARAIAADPDTVTSAEFLSPASTIGTTATSPAVQADQSIAGFPRAGSTYAILSSGSAAGLLSGSHTDGEQLGQNDGPGLHGSFNVDTTVLRVDVDVPLGTNCVSVDLRFFSDEDQDFYQEALVLERDLTTWAMPDDHTLTASDNFAVGAGSTPLTVNSPLVTAGAVTGINRAWSSGVLTASTSITGGAHSIFISVSDQADQLKNTDAMLDNLRFSHVADPTTQCQTGARAAITNVAPPVVQGTPSLGSTLTATTGTWNLAGLAYTYQWLRGGTPIAGATAKTYTPATADVGQQLSVQVTASNGSSVQVTGAATAPVTQPTSVTVLEQLTSAQPTIKGKARVGKTLTARPGAWGPGTVSFAYQWYRGDKPIRGARAATYRVTKKDRGKSLHVVVTGSEPGFVTVTRTSPSTKQVRPG